MKPVFSIFLAMVLCLTLLGCQQGPQYEKPVNFYYLAAELSYEAGTAAIRPETRESSHLKTAEAMLDAYLTGPESERLRSPFPANLTLVSLQQEDATIYLTLSNELAQLSGLDLVMACGCITMTCLELTGAQTVSIQAEDSLLNGQKAIIMDKDSLLLLDEMVSPEGT